MMKTTLLLALVIISLSANLEASLQFFQYCHYHNYPVEDHLIPTDDHYNLRYYRLQARNTSITSGKRVIYLQHGLVDSSDTWIVNDPNLAPAFYFADKGFDVWVGNSRGNRYSHKALSPVVLNFWDFTFHDMAKYDLPAALRYINRVTQKKIHYIGHSQGTLIMFIALSSQLRGVQQYLASFNAYGPVAYLKHQSSKLMSALAKTSFASLLYKNHIKWALMQSEGAMKFSGLICKYDKGVCITGLKLISQKNVTVNNLHRLPVIMSHFPSGSSTKNLLHFQQFTQKEEFKQFDYGQKKNLVVYGQKTPPFYELAKITFPVHLYVGKYDRLADVQDSDRLFKELINSQGKTMKIYDFGHATFIWGKTTEHLDDAIAVINKAESPEKEQEIAISGVANI